MKPTSIRTGAGTTFVAAALILLTACGSGNPAAAPGTIPLTAAPGSPADSATTAAVSKAYRTLFGGSKDLATLVSSVQNGDKLSPVFAQALKNPLTVSVTATVSKVTVINPHVASVTFTLLSHGSPLLANTKGKAVLVAGTWRVAADTYCGLLAASGHLPSQCSPAVIAVPSS